MGRPQAGGAYRAPSPFTPTLATSASADDRRFVKEQRRCFAEAVTAKSEVRGGQRYGFRCRQRLSTVIYRHVTFCTSKMCYLRLSTVTSRFLHLEDLLSTVIYGYLPMLCNGYHPW